MKNEKLRNRLTNLRLILSGIIILILVFPFSMININFKKYLVDNIVIVDLKMMIIGVLFVISSFTDFLDGHLARKYNNVSDYGKLMDPIADKVLVITALIILVELGKIPSWIPIIIVLREFIVSGYRLVAVEKGGNVIAANIWGKIKTVTQMFAIILDFVDNNAFGSFIYKNLNGYNLYLNFIASALMIMSVIATIFSGWNYIKGGRDLLKD